MYAIRRSIQRRSAQAGIIIVALCLDAFSSCYFLVNVFSVSDSHYDISLWPQSVLSVSCIVYYHWYRSIANNSLTKSSYDDSSRLHLCPLDWLVDRLFAYFA